MALSISRGEAWQEDRELLVTTTADWETALRKVGM
jgi:hypothetical protein